MNNNERLHTQPTQYNLKPILAISHDVEMLRSLDPEFRQHGYRILHATHPEKVEKAIDKHNPKYVILDDDVENHFPEDFDEQVISVLESDSPDGIDQKMKVGVASCLVKPLNPEHARRAIQRLDSFSVTDVKDQVFIFGNLIIDRNNSKLHHDGLSTYLTRAERLLLEILAENEKNIVSHDEILQFLKDCDHPIRMKSLKVIICTLREKLGEVRADVEIPIKVYGGYKLQYKDEK